MIQRSKKDVRRGLVVSDLHFFSARWNGTGCFDSIRSELPKIDFLVLNGDIFDFRWGSRGDVERMQIKAIEWLTELTRDYPQCELHYVLGNHDCGDDFHALLNNLSASEPRFHVHEYWFESGSALFMHGDCANRTMDLHGLKRMRARYKRERRLAWVAMHVYLCVERIGWSWLIHRVYFPQRQTIRRITYFLDRARPGWRKHIRNCYFGHTHLPFTNLEHEGVLFHNTGSGNLVMGFEPRVVEELEFRR